MIAALSSYYIAGEFTHEPKFEAKPDILRLPKLILENSQKNLKVLTIKSIFKEVGRASFVKSPS